MMDRLKFPKPQDILSLLEQSQDNDKEALNLAELTLEKMYKSGIFDHIGYGFFGYSEDERWLVPNFEKRLDHNALMALAYTRAYEINNKPIYQDVADKIFEFIIRDLLSEKGTFYSALGAGPEGQEGRHYLMTKEDIIGLLDEEWGEAFCNAYNITEEGNFEGGNIPNLIGKDLDDLDSNLESMIEMLFTYREMRPKPSRDGRILTSWNELIIESLAYAGRVLENDFYIRKAKEAADYILEN